MTLIICYVPSNVIAKMNQYIFWGVGSSAKIYTDATGEDSSWQEGWNSYGTVGKLEIVYNTSLEQYKALHNIEYWNKIDINKQKNVSKFDTWLCLFFYIFRYIIQIL